MFPEPRIGSGKMPIPKKAPMCRQRRRMRRLQHQMPAAIDMLTFLLRMAAPQQKHQFRAFLVEHGDNAVGETLPALALV